MKCAYRAGGQWSVVSGQWSVFSVQCSVIAKSPLGGRGSCRAGIPGRARLPPSRASVLSARFSVIAKSPFGTDAPYDPRDTAACRAVRLSGSFALPRRVNTRGNAICRCAQDFALIRKNSRCVGHRKGRSLECRQGLNCQHLRIFCGFLATCQQSPQQRSKLRPALRILVDNGAHRVCGKICSDRLNSTQDVRIYLCPDCGTCPQWECVK